MQCVANGTVYLGGAVGALQVLRVRAMRRRAPVEHGTERSGEQDAPAAFVHT